ncbi:MAG: OmpA family protein, partial [Cyclobacteriaceae bacterium]|nr:OmpA family protein [Cyclobacteriaceae bacterium]
MKHTLWAVCLAALACGSCVKGAFSPVNVGREYGNPKLPIMVSHLPEANQWVLSRTGPHYFLRHVVCFDYTCRKMIGRRKALKAISFEAYKKGLRKNAKKGMYKKSAPATKPVPTIKPVRPDTVIARTQPKQTQPEQTQAAGPERPILKADSLITLGDLLFETNSYKLKGEHFAALDSLGKFLLAHPTLEVLVSGHTDNTGTERHNVALSTRRAEVVAEYLVDRGAVFERVT